DSHDLELWPPQPQGLEFNAKTRQLWGTEHGPRGGDEINLLLPGRNYGWPAFSKGQNYDGSEVKYGRADLELELKDIEQPVVDLTPSPGVSSLVFYDGEAFPEWRDDLIVATLKASDLFRVEISDNKFVRKEPLIENLARIRDVEVGPGGIIYLLLEHATGSKIVRVVPAKTDAG
ncbi:MAG: PQQ-dependent sugar dehydrogenase, partial [Proteobacteria bacterium]|nr:PQQ-dependent sugar dehydrogenase [Pseudomonadota bacterium]